MRIPPQLICERHSQPLTTANPDGRVEDAAALTCSQDCCVPIVEGIPRFVDRDNYASGFGLQWKAFSKTQLDSHTGTTISRDRLARCLGGSMGVVRDKNVLEVGCGAGRFTEVLLQSGAKVFACDLSPAVEANYDNCHASQNYFVCQADARHVPIAPHSFDFVICLGVIQHTPSPEETIAALSRYVRPGGTLIIDHYTHSYPRNFFQRNLRRVLIRLPPRRAKSAALMLALLAASGQAATLRGTLTDYSGYTHGRYYVYLVPPIAYAVVAALSSLHRSNIWIGAALVVVALSTTDAYTPMGPSL